MTQSKNKIGDLIECSCCGKTYEKHRKHGRRCRDCERLKRKQYYHSGKGKLLYKKYEKTKNGFLMRLYRNMKSRVLGICKHKRHLYYGLEILDKEEFYAWAKNNEDFHSLFKEWEESGYERRLTPSVDRIDARHGYVLINMEFVPFHENCRNIRRF